MSQRLRVLFPLTVALLCLGILLTGCGASSSATLTGHSSATATPKPPAPLAVELRTLPAKASGWAVSPVDGRHAWICVKEADGSFTVWASHDAGATWAKAGNFHPQTSEPPSDCSLRPDQGDVQTLVAVIDWGSGEVGTLRSLTELSTDGGANWRRLTRDIAVTELQTVSGKTYAAYFDSAATGNESTNQLVISTDGLQTWKTIQPVNFPANDSFFSFQLGATPGDLIAASYAHSVWHSTDGGATWTQIPAPNDQTNLYRWLPQANQWMLCNWSAQPTIVQCSTDLGQTWQQKPALSFTTICPAKCVPGQGTTPVPQTTGCYPTAITDDGALISLCQDDVVYRLAPQTQVWRALGTSPIPLAELIGNQLFGQPASPDTVETTTLYIVTLPD